MEKIKLVERRYLLPFILVTALFALWGFANDITNPMVAAFQTLLELSAAKASMVQFAFYGGYATMAVPAALFIRRHSYKSGVLLGLALYAGGAFLFIPAAACQSFVFFCTAYYILTFGLAFLETSSNPFILSMGAKESSTRRLNLSQAFNPMGSLCGMGVASFVVLPQLLSDKRDAAGQTIFATLSEAEKADIRVHDLAVISNPYVIIGIVVLCMFAVIALTKMPKSTDQSGHNTVKQTLSNLWNNKYYREGVAAQVFYVAAQIMTWTFIIHYADRLGIDKATAQTYNIFAMVMFLCSRFICTFLMRYVNTRLLLSAFALGATLCTLGAIIINGIWGLYSLVCVSFFMSLMFPTIYGIALERVEPQDTSLGAAFLVMAIVGGALMPPIQGMVIDCGEIDGMPAVNLSFFMPLVCFIMVGLYGMRAYKRGVKNEE